MSLFLNCNTRAPKLNPLLHILSATNHNPPITTADCLFITLVTNNTPPNKYKSLLPHTYHILSIFIYGTFLFGTERLGAM
ncbi:MAG: hypothetical protein ACKPKO_31600, partial [Candidatus Fonsibacter sp.]